MKISREIEMKKLVKLATLTATAFICYIATGNVHAANPSVTAKENLQELLKTKSCKGCDLSGLNLNRLDLSGADLEGADLSLSTLFLTNLSGANLRNSKLNGAAFGGCDLGDADLSGADLRGANLATAYLEGAKVPGKFVTSKPYESIGVTEVEKEVYVEDQAKPKRSPQQKGVRVNSRRDIGEAPPVVAEKEILKREEKKAITHPSPQPPAMSSSPEKSVQPVAPTAKRVKPLAPVIIDETVVKQNLSAEKTMKKVKAEPAIAAVPQKNTRKKNDSARENKKIEEREVENKAKRENLAILFDKNRCFECDLSGLDLSGKDLEDADLEGANLNGTNLEKADLEGANLKGASLKNANLQNSDLEDTDFYKSDLSGANLTGAKQKNTMFDDAKIKNAIGIELGPVIQQ